MNVGKIKLANIGPKEARKRLLMGVAMLAMGGVLAVIFAHADVSRGWYAVLFLPFWMGTLPVCEARKRTWVVFAARGARKMNGSEEPVGDEKAEKRLRSQAHWIYVESAIAALILTVLSCYFTSALTEAARSSKGLSLEQAADFLVNHGYTLLFGWVLVEQMGLPIPAIPLLIAAGALARAGKMNLTFAVILAFSAVILADLFWYTLGRYRGARILKLLCRISLEPDSCVRRTENVFVHHGVLSLLVAKFIPGLNTAAPSLAGIFRMPLRRFTIFDSLGGLFWVVSVTSLGLIFSDQLEQIALRWGGWLLAAVAGGLAAYVLWKFIQRRRFLRGLRIARITPKELMDKLTAGENISIVDLRQPIDIEAFPQMIPGALRIAMEEIEARHGEIPRDRDVVLYCSWPNEATSARVALLLRAKGITRVRPLEGGIDAWLAYNFPFVTESLVKKPVVLWLWGRTGMRDPVNSATFRLGTNLELL